MQVPPGMQAPPGMQVPPGMQAPSGFYQPPPPGAFGHGNNESRINECIDRLYKVEARKKISNPLRTFHLVNNSMLIPHYGLLIVQWTVLYPKNNRCIYYN